MSGALVRPARAGDVAAMVAMAERFHAASDAWWPFSAAHIDMLIRTLIASPDGLCLVLERDGAAAGMLVASYGDHPLGAGRYGMEIGFWIDPGARAGEGAMALLTAYRDAAKSAGCRFIGLAALADETSRPSAIARLFRRAGFRPREQHFDMVL